MLTLTKLTRHFGLWLTVVILIGGTSSAQFGPGGGGGGGGGFGGGGGAGGGGFPGGILIDGEGVIQQSKKSAKLTSRMRRELKSASNEFLSQDVNQSSDLRVVSLRRISATIAKRLDAKEAIGPELLHLAGLTRVDWIIVDPEQHDLLLAGPAEGFAPMPDGRVVAVETGRPVLRLEDLVVLLRNAAGGGVLGCSFDPDPARLVQVRQVLQQNTTARSFAHARQGFQQAGSVLGNWQVSVFGVNGTSSVALGFVEADYQLKRTSLGFDNPGVRGFRSHLALLRPGANMMSRWWFVPRYDAVERDADGEVFHLLGPRIQLRAQEEIVDSNGNRSDAPTTQRSTKLFAQQFNKNVDQIAEKVPAFSHLQNLIDLAVVSSVYRNAVGSQRFELDADCLLADARMKPTEYDVPREVPSMVNVRSGSSRTVLGLIAGGVTVVPQRIVQGASPAVDSEADLKVDAIRSAGMELERWWWDAK